MSTKQLAFVLLAALAVSCGGTAEMPTAPTSNPGTPLLGSVQTSDMHPAPGADPEPGAVPAPPLPPAEPTPGPTSAFDGTYSATTTGGRRGGTRLTFLVATGVIPEFIIGDVLPFSGTVSASGAVAIRSLGNECQRVTLAGQITITASGAATVAGTWFSEDLLTHPGDDGCYPESGAWTGSRTTPAPPPAPTSLTGRWIGVAPDGNIISDPQSCDSEQDLTFDLTQTGTTLSGTISDRPRKHNPSVCSAPTIGRVVSLTGTVGADDFSFTVPGERGRTVNCSGTFTRTRLTGTCDSGNGTFAVNRQ